MAMYVNTYENLKCCNIIGHFKFLRENKKRPTSVLCNWKIYSDIGRKEIRLTKSPNNIYVYVEVLILFVWGKSM